MPCKEALAVEIAGGETVDVKVGPAGGNKRVHIENSQNYAFCEFGLILGDSFETAEAHIWNTTGASNCPPKYRVPPTHTRVPAPPPTLSLRNSANLA